MLKENDMAENRSSVSKKKTYKEIGEYWDRHELSDQATPVAFQVDLRASSVYFPLDRALAERLRSAAEAHGVSTETLLNLWVQERVAEESQKGRRRPLTRGIALPTAKYSLACRRSFDENL